MSQPQKEHKNKIDQPTAADKGSGSSTSFSLSDLIPGMIEDREQLTPSALNRRLRENLFLHKEQAISGSLPSIPPNGCRSPGVLPGKAMIGQYGGYFPLGVDYDWEVGEPQNVEKISYDARAVMSLIEAVNDWKKAALTEEAARKQMFEAVEKVEKTKDTYSMSVKRYWSQARF